MRSQFPLFQSHLDMAHDYWKKLVQSGDTVIDATCGNGQDTLILAQQCLNEKTGSLYAIDILPKAIEKTKNHLAQTLDQTKLSHVHFIQGCHSSFPAEIPSQSVKLIVYNLGYLPGGGDKTKTTMAETTLKSFKNALDLIQPGGAISIALYPGHPEGEVEENLLLPFVKELNPLIWNCCHHRWLNRTKSPSLLFIQRSYNTVK